MTVWSGRSPDGFRFEPILRRVRVARAKRSNASVDGRTLPPFDPRDVRLRGFHAPSQLRLRQACGRSGRDQRPREVELCTERVSKASL